jgi:hypothetical protein
MEMAERTAVAQQSGVRTYDVWIIVGYAAFAVLTIAATYLASGGPGVTSAELANAMVVLP